MSIMKCDRNINRQAMATESREWRKTIGSKIHNGLQCVSRRRRRRRMKGRRIKRKMKRMKRRMKGERG